VNVDKPDEVREAGTDGDGPSSQKIMFDTVDEDFEGIMDDEKVWNSIPKEARGEAWTRRIYHFNDEHDAKLFYERVEEKLHQINLEVRDDQEIKGHVSWASADNNRGDSFNSAMCLYVKQQPRAYNTKQEETATDKVEWAAVTLEQIFQDQQTKDRLKGKVKAVYVMENWLMRDMTPEEKVKKGDEDILILMLATPEDAAAIINCKGMKKLTMTATRMRGHVPVDKVETICTHATSITLSDVLERKLKLAKLMAHAMMGNTQQANIDAIMEVLSGTKAISQKTRNGQSKTTDLLFTPVFLHGLAGEDMRIRLNKLLEKQVISKRIHEEVKALRIAYAARFNISYRTTRRKGGGGTATKAMEKGNEQTGKLITAMAAQKT
jgi:hypothetical protein